MLVNAPLVNQLADGDVNTQADCASAATASGLMALNPALHLTGGTLKDAAYGVAYTGPTDVVRYIPEAAQDGVVLWNVTGNADTLIQTIEQCLAQGMPVLGAIPSQWGLDYTGQDMQNFAGPTHEVLFCDHVGDTLTAMNPWPVDGQNAFYQTQPVAWWHQRLVYGRVDPMRHTSGAAAVSYNVGPGIAAYLAANPQYGQAASDEVYVGNIGYVTTSTGALVYWDKSAQTVKTDGATVLAAVSADLKAQVSTFQARVVALTQQMSDALTASKAAADQATLQIAYLKAQVAGLIHDNTDQAAQISDLKTQLQAIQSYPRGPVTGNINADAIGTRSGSAKLSLLARARANLSLSPAERGLYRLMKGAAISAGVAVATGIVEWLPQLSLANVDPQTVLRNGGYALVILAIEAGVHYFQAHADPPLASVAGAVEPLLRELPAPAQPVPVPSSTAA